MLLTLIAAMSENRVIGRDNALPWRLPADLKRFKQRTTGHTVIVGRRTFEAVGAPLPHRDTIIITRQREYAVNDARVVHTFDDALELVRPIDDEVFVLGGGEIYRQALPLADRLDLTIVHATIEGDTFFPPLDESAWTLISDERHLADAKNEYAYSFRMYERK